MQAAGPRPLTRRRAGLQSPITATAPRQILTVTQLNRLVSGLLDERFADVWVTGEVSNFRAYPSGHLYFTLKDEGAQVSTVVFRTAAARLKFRLEDGLQVVAHGRLDVYVPNGKYQLILDAVEPRGQGALQLAFEQLKRGLEAEGLFRDERKRPVPELPQVIGIVTSPSGAAIRDMLKTLRLHQARAHVLVCPAQVQGEGAASQIVEGIRRLNARGSVDVIIVGRGGGSIEDLWPFNEEAVARAIAASQVPVVTGIGHEVDFTIADFAADYRAATPTAAAQYVSRGWDDLARRLRETGQAILEQMQQRMLDREQHLESLTARLHHEALNIRFRALGRVRTLIERISGLTLTALARRQATVKAAAAKLDALSPLASLERGYALCRRPDGELVRSVGQVQPAERVDVRLSDGTLECEVKAHRRIPDHAQDPEEH
jgi:exodeoxyribonuclease VII large subunit